MIKLKDFILDEIPPKEENEAKKRNKTEYRFSLEYENDSDFILKRTSLKSEKLLVCLVSQGQIYIKDNKANTIESVTKLDQIKRFKQGMLYEDRPKFTKLQWKPFEDYEWSDFKRLFTDINACKELMNMKMNPFKDYQMFNDYRFRKDEFLKNFEYSKAVRLVNPNVRYSDYSRINENFKKANITYNNVKENLDTINELGAENFLQFFNEYNVHLIFSDYNCNFKTFLTWLTYTIKHRNGLSLYNYYGSASFRCSDYLDYLNMQYQMYGKVKEKYPEYWLTDKHIMNNKYNDWKRLKNNTEFGLHQENLMKQVSYNNDFFQVVVPLKNTDILDEAEQQRHCVASYIDKIMKKETNIVFIRDKNDLETSLLTVEIRDNKICQVRGFQNRNYNKVEYDFMKEWAEKTGLVLEVPDVKV